MLQVKIAREESKFGLDFTTTVTLINSEEVKQLNGVNIVGLMGMATNTANIKQVSAEFKSLHTLYEKFQSSTLNFSTLSMGMSGDYKTAIQHGSTMVRIGSTIFGT